MYNQPTNWRGALLPVDQHWIQWCRVSSIHCKRSAKPQKNPNTFLELSLGQTLECVHNTNSKSNTCGPRWWCWWGMLSCCLCSMVVPTHLILGCLCLIFGLGCNCTVLIVPWLDGVSTIRGRSTFFETQMVWVAMGRCGYWPLVFRSLVEHSFLQWSNPLNRDTFWSIDTFLSGPKIDLDRWAWQKFFWWLAVHCVSGWPLLLSWQEVTGAAFDLVGKIWLLDEGKGGLERGFNDWRMMWMWWCWGMAPYMCNVTTCSVLTCNAGNLLVGDWCLVYSQ